LERKEFIVKKLTPDKDTEDAENLRRPKGERLKNN